MKATGIMKTTILWSAWLLGLSAVVAASPGRERIRRLPLARVTQSVPEERILERAAATTAAPSTTAPNDAIATNICGWVGGNAASPWVCLALGTCIIDTAVKAIGCCEDNYCGLFRTACIPITAVCDDTCQSNGANLICPSSKPVCATWSYPNSVTEVRCVSEYPASSELQIEYTYAGFTTPIALPRILTGITGTTAPGSYTSLSIQTQTPASSSSSSGSTSNSQKSSSSSSASSGSATPSQSSSSEEASPNRGAIAGGVVGGLAVLAGVIGAAVFFWRKKSQQRTQVGPNGQVRNESGWRHIPFIKKGYAPVVAGHASELQGFPKTKQNSEPTELESDTNTFDDPRRPAINPRIRQSTLSVEMEG